MTGAAVASRWTIAPLAGAVALEETEWNALARRGFHLYQWFRAAEDSGWLPRHVLVRRDDEAGAVFPAYLTGADTPHDLHERWLGPLRDIERIGLALRPVLSVQSPFALTSEALGDAKGLSNLVLERVFDLLEETAAGERAKAVVWPFVDAADEAVIAVARERGYVVVPSGVTALLRVRWSSFEEYTASRGKSVRRTIRADLAALRAAGLETVGGPGFAEHADRMDAVYRAAYRRRNGRDPKLAAGWFRRLAAEAAPGIDAMLTWKGGQLAGTSFNLAAGDVLDGTFSAFRQEERGGPAYVNDLVYEPIRVACARGHETIDLGMSALYPKVLRGARLRRRVALVRGSSLVVHRALAALGQAVARRQEMKERRMLGALWDRQCYEDAGESR